MSAWKTLALSAVLLATLSPLATAGHIKARPYWRLTSWTPEPAVRTMQVPQAQAAPAAAPPTPSYSSAETNNLPLVLTSWSTLPQLTSNSVPATTLPSGVSLPTPPAAIITPPSPPPTYAADAYINFGSGPYAEADVLTTGGAQAWYNSPVVQALYHGVPDAQQRADFTNTVLQRIEQTYQQSGVPVQLTTDPHVAAAHSVSVVSNTSYSANTSAIGIADIGSNGFDFIDKLSYANSVDQLEWAVAHNVAHELMHSFGVDHHDTTGTFLDAASSPWSVLIDPSTVFSQAAAQDLLSRNFRAGNGSSLSSGAEQLDSGTSLSAAPVPEPATMALWSVAGLGIALARRLRGRRAAA